MLELAIVAIIIATIAGAPLFAIILAIAMVGFHFQDVNFMVIPIEIYRTTDTSLLIAIPLFTVAGFIFSASNTSTRFIKLTNAIFGRLPQSLAIVTLITCALFTAFTGASGVTIVALGALLYPALIKDKYPEKYSLGLVTSSGSLGLLLPPSLPLILYGVIAQQMEQGESVTISNLFLAGIIPATVMIILLIAYSMWTNKTIKQTKIAFSKQNLITALKESKWEIPLPFVVLGGIYSGFFAISEAAVITVLYAFIVEVLIYRDISFNKLSDVIKNALLMVGGIMIIFSTSLALTNYLVDAEIPMKIFDFIQNYIDSKLAFLLLLNIFLLALGAILDIFSALVIIVPLILPVAISYGVNPTHLGIIFLANMQIGYLTPPVGMNLFIASYRFKKPITELYSASLPFMLILLLALALITYIPTLSLVFIN